jgi:hypothetical protein
VVLAEEDGRCPTCAWREGGGDGEDSEEEYAPRAGGRRGAARAARERRKRRTLKSGRRASFLACRDAFHFRAAGGGGPDDDALASEPESDGLDHSPEVRPRPCPPERAER